MLFFIESSSYSAVSQFIGGLELQLQGMVRMQHPHNLQEAYTMAKLHDVIIQSQIRPHAHARLSFPPGKQSLTAMGTIGRNDVENRVALYKSGNAGNHVVKKCGE